LPWCKMVRRRRARGWEKWDVHREWRGEGREPWCARSRMREAVRSVPKGPVSLRTRVSVVVAMRT